MSWFELIFKVQNQQKIGLDEIESKIKKKIAWKKSFKQQQQEGLWGNRSKPLGYITDIERFDLKTSTNTAIPPLLSK